MNYRIAYCHPPSLGGPFTHFINLNKALSHLGWELYFVGVGPGSKVNMGDILEDHYVYIGDGNKYEIRNHVSKFIDWIQKEKISIILSYGDYVSIQSLPHLPPSIKVVTVCAIPTIDAVTRATIHIERINRIIAVSEGIHKSMIAKFRVPSNMIIEIPSAVDLAQYPPKERIRSKPVNRPIRIIFLGRIQGLHKGIELLPPITEILRKHNVQFELIIVGEGPEKKWLEGNFKKLKIDTHIKFFGEKMPWEIALLLFDNDIMLMPSRIEGSPHVLLEAMAAGLVPVASHLHGSTDTIINHNINGLLCPVGKLSAFTDAICYLYTHPQQLKVMSLAARKKIEERFDLKIISRAYHDLFIAVLKEPTRNYPVQPISQFKPNTKLYKLDKALRSKIPAPIKKIIFTIRERLKY